MVLKVKDSGAYGGIKYKNNKQEQGLYYNICIRAQFC